MCVGVSLVGQRDDEEGPPPGGWVLEFRVQCSGFRVQSSGSKVQGLGCGVHDVCFRVKG